MFLPIFLLLLSRDRKKSLKNACGQKEVVHLGDASRGFGRHGDW